MFSRGRPNEDLKPFGIAPTFSGGNYMEFLLNIFTEVHFFNFFLELGCPGNPLQKSGKQVRRDQESSSGVLGGGRCSKQDNFSRVGHPCHTPSHAFNPIHFFFTRGIELKCIKQERQLDNS